MDILLVLFGLGVVLELGLYLPGLWRGRSFLALLGLLVTAYASSWLVARWPSVWSGLIAIIGLYRVFNCLRLLEGRMHERYLRRSTLRTSVVLMLLQIAVGLGWYAWHGWSVNSHIFWIGLGCLQVLGAIVLFSATHRRLRRTAWPDRVHAFSDKELPTLTIALPARNETEDLQQCLESLIASDYPKLEILVLDDCSQTRRTPEIIRSFAHQGVRFLEGEQPKPTWLAKTQAYDHLAREASGEYLLFCGVDIRFSPDSLRQMVAMALLRKKAMISLLPLRAKSAERQLAVVQAMRYAWELVPPRRLFRRPPVLSSCWIIRKDALLQAGGFGAATRSVVPEAHFARQLAKTDSYSFMRANQALGIASIKPAREQYETAIRMRYPQLHRRPENVLLLGLAYLWLLLPFVLVPAGFWLPIGIEAQLLSLVAGLLLVFTYLRVVIVTRTGSKWIAFITLPVGLATDIVLTHVSMWQYEFSTVEWKGRNVCIPAMHVIPHLPKL